MRKLKMIEVLVLVILLPLFALIISSSLKTVASCEKKYFEKSAPFNADRCIAGSFKKICARGLAEADEKEGFESFVKTYGSVLPVSSLCVETVGIKDRKKLLKCSWTSQNGGNFVLAVLEKEDL